MVLAYPDVVTDVQEITSSTNFEQLEKLTMQSKKKKREVIRRGYLL